MCAQHAARGSALAAERKATLNLRVGAPAVAPEQHPGSLPLPLHKDDGRCRIMGGIASSPAARLLGGSSDKHQNTTISQAPLFLLLRGATGAAPAAGDPGLPPASHRHSQLSQLSRLSQLYLLTSRADHGLRRYFKKRPFRHWVNNEVNSSHMRSLADFGGSLLCT